MWPELSNAKPGAAKPLKRSSGATAALRPLFLEDKYFSAHRILIPVSRVARLPLPAVRGEVKQAIAFSRRGCARVLATALDKGTTGAGSRLAAGAGGSAFGSITLRQGRKCSPDGAKRNPGTECGFNAAPGFRCAPSGLRRKERKQKRKKEAKRRQARTQRPHHRVRRAPAGALA